MIMIGHVPLPPLIAKPVTVPRAQANWRRRAIELAVALLAFAVWGTLAYKGGFRLLARYEGVDLGGSWVLDVLSFLIGVSGSIAGISALWALALRATGRTPRSFIGEPDDSPEDMPQRDRVIDRSLDRTVDRDADRDAERSTDTTDHTTR
jgi:hypothetical protein